MLSTIFIYLFIFVKVESVTFSGIRAGRTFRLCVLWAFCVSLCTLMCCVLFCFIIFFFSKFCFLCDIGSNGCEKWARMTSYGGLEQLGASYGQSGRQWRSNCVSWFRSLSEEQPTYLQGGLWSWGCWGLAKGDWEDLLGDGVSGPSEGVVCYSHASRWGGVLVAEHSPTCRGSRWCCCSMGDLQIDFSGEVFSKRCEK